MKVQCGIQILLILIDTYLLLYQAKRDWVVSFMKQFPKAKKDVNMLENFPTLLIGNEIK